MQAKQAIQQLLTETNQTQGWQIPPWVVDYQAVILADKIDKNPWQPEPSYAERFMKITRVQDYLELGNTCWFTRAVFPELGQRRGINSSYYVQMGESCYQQFLRYNTMPAVSVLAEHFEFLAETAYTAIRCYGAFRSMWDD
jgi:hypothetical protein